MIESDHSVLQIYYRFLGKLPIKTDKLLIMDFLLSAFSNTFFAWSLMGLVVGAGTRILDNQNVKGGILVAMILGVFGAILIGFIVKVFVGPSFQTLDSVSLFASLIGAIIFVNIQRFLLKQTDIQDPSLSSEPTAV